MQADTAPGGPDLLRNQKTLKDKVEVGWRGSLERAGVTNRLWKQLVWCWYRWWRNGTFQIVGRMLNRGPGEFDGEKLKERVKVKGQH